MHAPASATAPTSCALREARDRPTSAGRYVPDLRSARAARNFVRNVAAATASRRRRELGANPFKLGFIGSTDTHNGTPGAVDERRLRRPRRRPATPRTRRLPAGCPTTWVSTPAASPWCGPRRTRATRSSPRCAGARPTRTSGPRLVVRFFGGFDSPARPVRRAGLRRARLRGRRADGRRARPRRARRGAPRFAVSALRDPGTAARPGTPLQRIQIVKGWVDADGATHEQVYDVAGDARQRRAASTSRRCAPRGAGADALCAVWTRSRLRSARSAPSTTRACSRTRPAAGARAPATRAACDCERSRDGAGEGFEACCDPARPEDDPGARLDVADLVLARPAHGGGARMRPERCRRARARWRSLGAAAADVDARRRDHRREQGDRSAGSSRTRSTPTRSRTSPISR